MWIHSKTRAVYYFDVSMILLLIYSNLWENDPACIDFTVDFSDYSNSWTFLQCRIVVSDDNCYQSFSKFVSLKDASEWCRYVCHMQTCAARLVDYWFSSSCWYYTVFVLTPKSYWMNPTGFCFSIQTIEKCLHMFMARERWGCVTT